ncbi:hypothetical protein BDP27DRAFT_134804 [Rhodocollybia butyracea]|uniref:Uncharacterized protein n=1 Tax=Rhodocollybia butyracea TaxID=206335 RepID=A0A9P5P314_9AGAR|nr:hypothetical protein BDP27DRAFT_134804 [Rhodocollybia butyracea]
MGRWKELAYYHNEHNGSYAMTDLLNRCDGLTSVSFPILSKLCMSASMARTDLFNLFFSSRAPKLRDMALGYTFFDRPIRFNPRSRITHMDFIPGRLTFRICSKTAQAPFFGNARIMAVLQGSSSDDHFLFHFLFHLLSTLETLTVRHGYWTPAPSASNSVFPTLRLPSLKALHLEKSKSRWMLYDVYAEGKPWSNFEPFMAFVKQSFSQLTTFSIQKLYISDANLVCILEHLPTLQDLTVDDDDISPERSPISVEFVESLHGYVSSFLRPQESPIVPRLRSLKLLNVAATTFRDLSVVNMVQSRWRPTRLHEVGTCARVDCLREFIMIFRKRLEDDAGSVYSALALFEEEGMRVVVGQSDEA